MGLITLLFILTVCTILVLIIKQKTLAHKILTKSRYLEDMGVYSQQQHKNQSPYVTFAKTRNTENCQSKVDKKQFHKINLISFTTEYETIPQHKGTFVHRLRCLINSFDCGSKIVTEIGVKCTSGYNGFHFALVFWTAAVLSVTLLLCITIPEIFSLKTNSNKRLIFPMLFKHQVETFLDKGFLDDVEEWNSKLKSNHNYRTHFKLCLFSKQQQFNQTYNVLPVRNHYSTNQYQSQFAEISSQMETVLEWHREDVRRMSFVNNWHSISAILLAQNGFYYTGESDKVKCFCCGVTFEGWSEGDSPQGVHSSISPSCPLILGTDTSNIPADAILDIDNNLVQTLAGVSNISVDTRSTSNNTVDNNNTSNIPRDTVLGTSNIPVDDILGDFTNLVQTLAAVSNVPVYTSNTSISMDNINNTSNIPVNTSNTLNSSRDAPLGTYNIPVDAILDAADIPIDTYLSLPELPEARRNEDNSRDSAFVTGSSMDAAAELVNSDLSQSDPGLSDSLALADFASFSTTESGLGSMISDSIMADISSHSNPQATSGHFDLQFQYDQNVPTQITYSCVQRPESLRRSLLSQPIPAFYSTSTTASLNTNPTLTPSSRHGDFGESLVANTFFTSTPSRGASINSHSMRSSDESSHGNSMHLGSLSPITPRYRGGNSRQLNFSHNNLSSDINSRISSLGVLQIPILASEGNDVQPNLTIPMHRLDLGLAVHPFYCQLDVRHRSFLTWPLGHRHSSVYPLASAGFFYSRYIRFVRCFYCDILYYWERGENPAVLHAGRSPNCDYIQIFRVPLPETRNNLLRHGPAVPVITSTTSAFGLLGSTATHHPNHTIPMSHHPNHAVPVPHRPNHAVPVPHSPLEFNEAVADMYRRMGAQPRYFYNVQPTQNWLHLQDVVLLGIRMRRIPYLRLTPTEESEERRNC